MHLSLGTPSVDGAHDLCVLAGPELLAACRSVVVGCAAGAFRVGQPVVPARCDDAWSLHAAVLRHISHVCTVLTQDEKLAKIVVPVEFCNPMHA